MSQTKKISIGSDHAGFELKEAIRKFLESKGFEVEDFGCHDTNSVDYPDIAKNVARNVAKQLEDNPEAKGILVCGSGIGVSIAANKVKNIRAALCHNIEFAKLSRQHNNANILALSGRYTEIPKATRIVDTWLNTDFEGGRHQNRILKIED